MEEEIGGGPRLFINAAKIDFKRIGNKGLFAAFLFAEKSRFDTERLSSPEQGGMHARHPSHSLLPFKCLNASTLRGLFESGKMRFDIYNVTIRHLFTADGITNLIGF